MAGDRIDLREVMVQRLIAAVGEGVNLVVLVSDSTSTALIAPFAKRFPDRLVNVGIAEQNLLGVAAGMARGGYVAITANAAPFVVNRANEQLKNDICYTEANVKVAALNAGFAYGSLASTHHAIDDISILRGMGNILILAPSDPLECDGIFRFAIAHAGPVYVRMDNLKFPALHQPSYRFVPGALDVLRDGLDVTVFAVGSVVYEAAAASEALAAEGISVHLANVPSIRPLDRDAVAAAADRSGRVVTVEEHSLHGGLGSLVCEILAERGMGIPVRRLGIPEGTFAKAGPRADLRRFYGIDAAGVAAAVREAVGGKAPRA
jgi:transketolase